MKGEVLLAQSDESVEGGQSYESLSISSLVPAGTIEKTCWSTAYTPISSLQEGIKTTTGPDRAEEMRTPGEIIFEDHIGPMTGASRACLGVRTPH